MTDARPDAKPLQPRKTLRPRDAATLIVVDSSSGEPRVLLGRRRLDMVFMPGRYVFPGGRVDPGDRHVAVEEDLEPGNLKNLLVAMKGHPSPVRARALALAAVRETFEEAGLLIGKPAQTAAPPRAKAWQEFYAHGFRPALAPADVLCARHHAPRTSAPVRHALLLCARPTPSFTRSRLPTASFPTSSGIRLPRPAAWNCPISRGWCWKIWARGSRRARWINRICLYRSITGEAAIFTAT